MGRMESRLKFATNLNNTGKSGIVDVDTHMIICRCSEEQSYVIIKAFSDTQLLRKELEEANNSVAFFQSALTNTNDELTMAKSKASYSDIEIPKFLQWCFENGWSYVNESFVNDNDSVLTASELLQIYKNRAITSPPANQ